MEQYYAQLAKETKCDCTKKNMQFAPCVNDGVVMCRECKFEVAKLPDLPASKTKSSA